MIALIDVGNTNTKFVFIQQSGLTNIKRTENNVVNESFCQQHWYQATKIVIASVGNGKITAIIKNWAKKQNILVTEVFSEANKYGVTSGYDYPSQLGVDRWLALLGAAQRFSRRNCLIVDAGTATTIDLLTATGEHVGGWILPGIATMYTSLLSNTSKIHAEPQTNGNLTFAKNTSSNVNNGLWAATVGAIELALRKAQQDLITVENVVLTGGNAHQIKKMLSVEAIVAEELVFLGLQQYSAE